MMILSERSCASEAAETPRSSRTLAFALEICAEEFFNPPDSSVVSDARAGHGDEIDSSLSIERPSCSFDEAEQIEVPMESDDDDDDLQWANTKPAFKLPPRRFGSRRSRGSCRTRNISRKEKAMVSQKPVSSPRLIAHQHSGLISAHSVPFSGSFTPRKAKRFHGRRGRGPSIVPVNFPRRKGAVGNGGDPMSPDVTCLGRIRSKNLDSIRASGTICADLWMDQKVKCFETKNQLCAKVCKGGKKTSRRFEPVEAKSHSVEVARTRRERTANFARSLPDILQDVRKSEDYEPSAPPPNSLLLMRGCRALDNVDSGTNLSPVTENVDPSQPSEPAMAPPNSLLRTRGCRVRGNFFSPLELLNNTVPLKSEHEEACTVPLPTAEDFHSKKRKTATSGHLSLLDLIEKEQRATDEDVPTSELCNHTAVEEGGTSHTQKDIDIVNKLSEQKAVDLPQSRLTLYQRRSFAELSPVEVSWCKKVDR